MLLLLLLCILHALLSLAQLVPGLFSVLVV
jgi:hypothetical protein